MTLWSNKLIDVDVILCFLWVIQLKAGQTEKIAVFLYNLDCPRGEVLLFCHEKFEKSTDNFFAGSVEAILETNV